MREYLFKAQIKSDKKELNGKCVYGLPLYDDNDGTTIDGILKQDGNAYYIYPETLCEFTGIEYNGEKIFEGDYLEIDGAVYEVKMSKGCWVVENGEEWEFLFTQNDAKIIGNVHTGRRK